MCVRSRLLAILSLHLLQKMSAKIVVLLAILSLFAVGSQAQFAYAPYAYPYAYPSYYPYYWGAWGSNKNAGPNSGPAAPPSGPNGPPSFTNNAPRS